MALVKGDGGEGGEQRKKEEEDMVLQKSILMFTVLKYYMCRTTIINY